MPNHLTTIQGNGQEAQLGHEFANPITVRVTDDAGNGVSGQGVTFSVPTPPGEPTGTFTTPNPTFTGEDGYADIFVMAAVAPGTWYGLAQLSAALGTTSNWYLTNIAAGTPVAVSITAGANQKAAFNSAYGPLTAKVVDGAGTGVLGATVRFSVPAGHGTFPGGLTTVDVATAAGGLATAPTFTANAVAGTFTVTITVPINPALAATTTWQNVSLTTPTTVQAISGGGQQTAVSTAFPSVLRARVTNALGNPLSGVVVTFTSPATGASCVFPSIVTTLAVGSAVTDGSGYANSSIPTANGINGTYFVVASVAGATPAQFQLTNGTAYFPEVCTTIAATVGANNVGTNSTSWVNTIQAINGNVGGSFVTIVDNTTVAKILLCSPIAAAALAPIADEAIITKFDVTFEVKSSRTGTSFPSARVGIYNGTTIRKGLVSGGPGVQDTWEAQTLSFAAPFSSGATISGAQLKAGNFGVGFTTTNSGSTQAGVVAIRNAKLSVCYQNPNIPASGVRDAPLLLCEA